MLSCREVLLLPFSHTGGKRTNTLAMCYKSNGNDGIKMKRGTEITI